MFWLVMMCQQKIQEDKLVYGMSLNCVKTLVREFNSLFLNVSSARMNGLD